MERYENISLKYKELPHTEEGHFTEEHIEMIKKILVLSNPTKILEIGFNAGHSAILWLELSKAHLISVDIGYHNHIYKAMDVVNRLYGERFTGIVCDSKNVYPLIKDNKFELVFIDGDHSEAGLIKDLSLALYLKTNYILVDDYDLQAKDVIRRLIEKDSRVHIVDTYQKVATTPPCALLKVQYE